jgi:hypothetical protein
VSSNDRTTTLSDYLARVPNMTAEQAADLVKLLIATEVLPVDGIIEEDDRAGDVRLVRSSRATVATCRDCHRTFSSSAAAASHSRSTGDITDLVYATTFAYVPNERRQELRPGREPW